MKAGWQIKKLNAVCFVDKWQGIHKSLPYVGLEHIESHTGRFIGSTEPRGVRSSTFKFSPEHLLYGRLRPYLNKVMLPDFTGHCSTEIMPIKPYPGLLREFLQYWFLKNETIKRIDGTSTGTRMPRANMKEVLDFEFPLPPLSEQQRIVAILDEAFEGIATAKANAEKNLQNARALFESHLNAVFTKRGEEWNSRPFEDCIEDVKYTTKIQRKNFLETGKYMIVSQETALINGYWDNEADVFKAIKPVVIFGDHTKVLKYVDFDFVLGADGVKILQPKQFLNPKYFFYHLRSIPLKSLGYSRHYRLLKEVEINYPHLAEQNIIAEKLDWFYAETQRLESVYQQKIVALDELKKSLLQQAFTGQL